MVQTPKIPSDNHVEANTSTSAARGLTPPQHSEVHSICPIVFQVQLHEQRPHVGPPRGLRSREALLVAPQKLVVRVTRIGGRAVQLLEARVVVLEDLVELCRKKGPVLS
jgi:hypothetical protein